MAIWAVCKDPGGTNSIIPVKNALKILGEDISLIANGKAVDLLTAIRETFISANSANKLLKEMPYPSAIITSMCSGGGVGRDLCAICKDIPTVALQDFWGSRLTSDWADAIYRPRLITVNDSVGADLVKKAWPDFDENHIVVAGYPALDSYAGCDLNSAAAMAREKLDLSDNKPIVLYAGQLWGSAATLLEIVRSLNALQKDIYLIARPHPRMSIDGLEEYDGWQKALGEFRSGTVVDSSSCDTRSLIAASTVTISMFSTTLIEAAALRRDNISVLYPEIGMKHFMDCFPGRLLDEFPLVQLGCSAKATNQAELQALLKQSLNEGLNLTAKQEKHFKLDGNNARRVAELVVRQLNA